ncbi:MAG TPA: response regulator [Prolixibacteraceae bacterium]|nr:response regulator [Prolixibacteraceae bacterium]
MINKTSNNTSTRTKPMVILIAEDDDISFAYLEILLASNNCKILRTIDGLKTVEMVRNHPEIDIVLMDIKMPILDGISATMQIREFNKEIPIIAQTAYVFESDRHEALNAGCNDYLAKPIQVKGFINKMHKYLYPDTMAV